ncbi:MAG: hypothetical protein IJI03_02350 [Rudaea sp.]|uniref:hypothetical protein n=1 Tax=Rudaea sp. 3F27F6 TaxID=2502208 RepID=UPI0010F82844|nr:hypothetical protein [Rudaea sp. 3F27F6]MBR0344087.1 hypothetical protein [Rudaea sp.]
MCVDPGSNSAYLVIPANAGIQLLNSHEEPMRLHFASGWNATLYVDLTSDLIKRIYERKRDLTQAGLVSHLHSRLEAGFQRALE